MNIYKARNLQKGLVKANRSNVVWHGISFSEFFNTAMYHVIVRSNRGNDDGFMNEKVAYVVPKLLMGDVIIGNLKECEVSMVMFRGRICLMISIPFE